MHYIIQNKSRNQSQPVNAFFCDKFLCKFKGLMLKKDLALLEGIIFKNHSETIIDASIHMLFMNFDISVIWINKELQVVDKTVAKKWHPIYFPKYKAKFILETHKSRYDDYFIGDQLVFEETF